MKKPSFKRFKESFKKFIKQEPIYIWLVVFIILINLMVFFPVSKDDTAEEPPKKISKAERLIEDRYKVQRAIIEDEKKATIAALVVVAIVVSIFIGLILNLVIITRSAGRKNLLERSHASPKVRWSVWDALKVLILFFFFAYMIAIIASLLMPLFPPGGATGRIVAIVNTTIMDLVGMAIVFYFVIHRYRHKARDLGLTMKNFLKNISYGFLGYLSLLPILFVTLMVTALILDLFKYQPAPQPVFEMFLEEEKMPMLAYLSIFVAIAGPVMEEIFFRGFLYTAIKKEAGVKLAIIISALIFSFLHAHLVGFIPILILGIFLAYLYEKTGSLVSSMTVHIIHNLIMVSFIFLVKGISV